MHPHIGAAGHGALDLIASLQALASPLTPPGGAGNGASALNFSIDPSAGSSPFGPAAGSGPGGPAMTPDTMNALFAAQSQPPAASGSSGLLSQLFALLDPNGDGSISKSELETTLGQNGKTASADSLFAKLDANNDGSVSPDELASALQGQKAQHRHLHHGGEASRAGGGDNLLGSTTGQTVNNSDGSTTTTLSYADGSQVTMTTPAAGSSGTGTAANNFLERMIQHQAQMLASSTAGQSVAMSV